MSYKVDRTPAVNQQMRELAKRAKACRLHHSLGEALRHMLERLQNDPLEWGDPNTTLSTRRHRVSRDCLAVAGAFHRLSGRTGRHHLQYRPVTQLAARRLLSGKHVMPNLRRFLSRRWLLAFLGVAALLFGLTMLHPYPRQSLFGPTIRGKPWCVWEDAVRRYIHREDYENSWQAKVMRWFGVKHDDLTREDLLENEEMLPLLLQLADDPNRKVRREVLEAICYCEKLRDASALPCCTGDSAVTMRNNASWRAGRFGKSKRTSRYFRLSCGNSTILPARPASRPP